MTDSRLVGADARPEDIEITSDPIRAEEAAPTILPADFTGVIIQLSGEQYEKMDAWSSNIAPHLVPEILRQVAAGWVVPDRG